jgi:hypothetical protein
MQVVFVGRGTSQLDRNPLFSCGRPLLVLVTRYFIGMCYDGEMVRQVLRRTGCSCHHSGLKLATWQLSGWWLCAIKGAVLVLRRQWFLFFFSVVAEVICSLLTVGLCANSSICAVKEGVGLK